jgi:hypothetical protein
VGHAGVGGHAGAPGNEDGGLGAPVDETMEPIEASEERNAAMETEVMKGSPTLNRGRRTRLASRFTWRVRIAG